MPLGNVGRGGGGAPASDRHFVDPSVSPPGASDSTSLPLTTSGVDTAASGTDTAATSIGVAEFSDDDDDDDSGEDAGGDGDRGGGEAAEVVAAVGRPAPLPFLSPSSSVDTLAASSPGRSTERGDGLSEGGPTPTPNPTSDGDGGGGITPPPLTQRKQLRSHRRLSDVQQQLQRSAHLQVDLGLTEGQLREAEPSPSVTSSTSLDAAAPLCTGIGATSGALDPSAPTSNTDTTAAPASSPLATTIFATLMDALPEPQPAGAEWGATRSSTTSSGSGSGGCGDSSGVVGIDMESISRIVVEGGGDTPTPVQRSDGGGVDNGFSGSNGTSLTPHTPIPLLHSFPGHHHVSDVEGVVGVTAAPLLLDFHGHHHLAAPPPVSNLNSPAAVSQTIGLSGPSSSSPSPSSSASSSSSSSADSAFGGGVSGDPSSSSSGYRMVLASPPSASSSSTTPSSHIGGAAASSTVDSTGRTIITPAAAESTSVNAVASSLIGDQRGRGGAATCACLAPSGSTGLTHVVVFLNGIGGSTHDTRIMRAFLKVGRGTHIICGNRVECLEWGRCNWGLLC